MTAQPGAALTDIFSYGNLRGMSYQYYKTQDSGASLLSSLQMLARECRR